MHRYMRDRDGVVHELYPYAFMGNALAWSWPTGHVDARTRNAEAALDATAPTCLVCIREHERMPKHVRVQMARLLDKFMR